MISLARSDEPIASIIILTRDNVGMLRDCLAALAASIDPQRVPFEVIVLFQEMDDAVVRSFCKSTRGLRTLRSALNLGFGAGNNFAARHAKGEYLVFLNDDTLPQPGWLERLLYTARSDDRIGAVGSRLLFPDSRVQEAGAIVWQDGSCFPLGRGEPPGSLAYSYVRVVDHTSANGLLMPRAVFEAAGGFDERFFPGYYEDTDLSMTVRHRLGKRVVYEPRSVILHEESSTMKRDAAFRDFLFRRHQAMFCEKWGSELASYLPANPESPSAVRRAVLARRGDPPRVLIIDDRVPQPGIGSGFLRMVDMLRELQSSHFALALYPANELGLRGENPLAELGVDLVVEPLREHLSRPENQYDVVVISRPHNFENLYPIVRAEQPRATIVYDTEALYHRRLWLQASQETTPEGRARVAAEAAAMETLETRIAREADRIVTISEDERRWLEDVIGHVPIDFMVPLLRDVAMTPATLEGRDGAVFVAGWLGGEQSPNVAALQWYIERVLPRVRERLPGFTTTVTGARPPLSVECMATDGIVLSGFVESLDAVYRNARVAIAPIRAGAGVKNKTMEALQYGVPVVATAVGAEGLRLATDDALDVTDDPAEFAERIVKLATDDAAWMERRDAIDRAVARWQRERKSWEDVLSARGTLVTAPSGRRDGWSELQRFSARHGNVVTDRSYDAAYDASALWRHRFGDEAVALLFDIFEPRAQEELYDDALAALADFLEKGPSAGISPGPFFDADYVEKVLPATSASTPLERWLARGLAARIVPTPRFDEHYYLRRYPDLAANGVFGFAHFVRYGLSESRSPTLWFDPNWYAAAYDRGESKQPAYLDFLIRGARRHRAPSALVNEFLKRHGAESAMTLRIYDALAEASLRWRGLVTHDALSLLLSAFEPSWHGTEGPDALAALAAYLGSAQPGGSPGPLFEPDVYVERARDAGFVDSDFRDGAIAHWLAHGVDARIVPTRFFDEKRYRRANPDVDASPTWGFAHFLLYGADEGRPLQSHVTTVRLAHLHLTGADRRPPMEVRRLIRDRVPALWEDEAVEAAAIDDAERRLRKLSQPPLSETMAAARALEPAIGTVAGAPAFLAPYHDVLGLAHAEVRRRIPHSSYASIVCIPWMRMGGADLVAAETANSLLRLRPDERLLILRCDESEFDRGDWLPHAATVVDISDIRNALAPREAQSLLRAVFCGLQPRRILNVNSRLCWETFRRYGSRLSPGTRLYAYLFCWDLLPDGQKVGYPAEFFAETCFDLSAVFTDTEFLKNELSREYVLPRELRDRIVPLRMPARAPLRTPSVARVSLHSGRERNVVFWAGRLDEQKRFDLVQEVAALLPEVTFHCWGKNVMDAGPDHSRSPKNIVMHEPFVEFDELPIDRADAWLFTSAWEGMPNLLLEVGIRGFPVVASAVGGVPELISRETGWPVAPDAPASDYAVALTALLADPAEALRRGERLARAVAGRHTREDFDASLDSVFSRETA